MIFRSGIEMQVDMNKRLGLLRCKNVLTLLLCLILSPVSAFAQPSNLAVPRPSLPVDRGAIERLYGPNKNDTRGALSESGSYVRGTQLIREGFALKEVIDGGAFVEVVTFPKGYRYAAHDLFGSLLRTAAYDEKVSGLGDLSAAANKVRCSPWEYADGGNGGNICYVPVDGGQVQKGVVGWFREVSGDQVITVVIAYQHPRGDLPGQVIDNYLHEYPSEVPAQPTWHLDWETKDLEKWVEVLRTNKDDVQMLQAGAAYLTRYEKRAFGLLDALKKRDDAAAFSQALGGVNDFMTRQVEERKKAREAAQRGE
jgi:hypothetical protein